VDNKATGKKENKRMWCGNPKCYPWTTSHTTKQHGLPSQGSSFMKAGDLQLQSSLKKFMSNTTGKKLSKKDHKQLKMMLSQMLHDKTENDKAFVDSD
jgi:hypothetical protein